MIAKIPNLWPETLGPGLQVTPRAIMQRQAQVLTEQSAGGIRGDIGTRVLGPDFLHTFCIVAPEVEGFRYLIARVRHSVHSLYPLRVSQSETEENWVQCDGEPEFMEHLRGILHGKHTVSVVQSLLSQLPAAAQ